MIAVVSTSSVELVGADDERQQVGADVPEDLAAEVVDRPEREPLGVALGDDDDPVGEDEDASGSRDDEQPDQ